MSSINDHISSFTISWEGRQNLEYINTRTRFILFSRHSLYNYYLNFLKKLVISFLKCKFDPSIATPLLDP